MKAKKKRKWIWCSETPISLQQYVWFHETTKPGVFRSADFKPGEKRVFKNDHEEMIGARKTMKIPSQVRCPNCNKKFKPRIRECGDRGCWHAYVPPHKKWVKVD